MTTAGWRTASLKEVCEPPQYGYTASAEDKGNVRFLRITDITESGVKWPSVPFCECPPDLLPKYQLASGDIVFARIGATTGKSYLITNPPLSVFASYLIRVRCKSEIDPAFLSMFFRSESYWQQVDAQKDTNLKKGVNGSVLRTLQIAVPPLPEQRKIAGVLGVVQRAIEQQERLLALTAELKKALLHQLFTAGLRGEPQKETAIGLVPDSWEVVQLGDLALIERGKFAHRPRNESRFYGGSTPFVQTGDVSNCDGRISSYSQTLNDDGVQISKVFAAGTILITIAANIGFTGILDFDSACPDSLIGLTPRAGVSAEFLQYYLSTQQPEMDRLAPRGTQKNINIQFLRPWPVPVPSEDEQSEIVSCLRVVDSKLRVGARRHAALTALFRTLLHQLMTAELRLHDLDLPELEATL